MILDSSGSSRRNAATVSGASASSRRAVSSYPPALIRSIARSYVPAALETYAATRVDLILRQLPGEGRHHAEPVRDAVGDELGRRLGRVEVGADRAGRAGVGERVAGRAARRGEDLPAECDVRGRRRCGGGSSARSTQTASATNASAPATGIHQCVRPVWRRLKKSRAHAPIAIRTISTNQAWSAP